MSMLTTIVLFLVVSQFLPGKISYQKSVSIDSGTYSVYSYIADLKNWGKWSYWNRNNDKSLLWFFREPTSGVNSSVQWGGVSGNGELIVIDAIKDKKLRFSIFYQNDEFYSDNVIYLQKINDSTRVSWQINFDLGRDPTARYMALFGNFMSDEISYSLDNLKAIMESKVK